MWSLEKEYDGLEAVQSYVPNSTTAPALCAAGFK